MARSHRYNKSGPLKGGVTSYRLDMQAQVFTPAEARAEYARLRREANRRLDVLARRGEKVRRDTYEALPAKASEQTVRRALADVARYLGQRTSSYQGLMQARRNKVEGLQAAGYGFVNMSNIDDFGQYMGDVQKHKAAKGYDSDQYAELFHVAKEKHIDTDTLADNFEFWLKHRNALEDAPRSQSIISSEDFAARIGLKIDQ